jgi:hypothetical protein
MQAIRSVSGTDISDVAAMNELRNVEGESEGKRKRKEGTKRGNREREEEQSKTEKIRGEHNELGRRPMSVSYLSHSLVMMGDVGLGRRPPTAKEKQA